MVVNLTVPDDVFNIQLTLKPVESKLNGTKCRDNANKEIAKLIKNSPLIKHRTEQTTFNKFMDNLLNNNGIIQYYKGHKEFKNPWGRVYADGLSGLQNIETQIKNTLIKKDPFNDSNKELNYIDLDIKNCIPTILNSIISNNINDIKEILTEHRDNLKDEKTKEESKPEPKQKKTTKKTTTTKTSKTANRTDDEAEPEDTSNFKNVHKIIILDNKTRLIKHILKNGFIYLKTYIKTRDDILNNVINVFQTDKATAKELFNSMNNGGTFYGWKRKKLLYLMKMKQ